MYHHTHTKINTHIYTYKHAHTQKKKKQRVVQISTKTFAWLYFLVFFDFSNIFPSLPNDCRNQTAWNFGSDINIYVTEYIYIYIYIYIYKLIYIYIYYYYFKIALSQILCTLQIIPYLVCHKPTKWESDNHTLLYIYIYIYTLSSTDRLFRCIKTLLCG